MWALKIHTGLVQISGCQVRELHEWSVMIYWVGVDVVSINCGGGAYNIGITLG